MTGEEKQKAINALKKSAPIMAMTQQEFSDYIQTINQVMDWLEQEPCDDCISRQAVKELFQEACEMKMYDFLGIDYIPSVTPQPKTEVLDKIRAEIDTQDNWLSQAGYNAYNVDIAFNSIKRVIAESEE